MCIPQQSTAAAVSPPCSVPLAAFSSASLPFSSLVSPLAASSFARSASAERRERRNARSFGFGEARSLLWLACMARTRCDSLSPLSRLF